MATDCNYTSCHEHFVMYVIAESLYCIPEINIIISLIKNKKNTVVELDSVKESLSKRYVLHYTHAVLSFENPLSSSCLSFHLIVLQSQTTFSHVAPSYGI